MRRRWSRGLALVTSLAVVLGLAACQQGEPEPAPPGGAVRLSFGVSGPAELVAAYQSMVDDYNAEAESVEVDLVSWPTREAMATDLGAGGTLPDIYLVARRDLADVIEQERNVPLFELLEERDVSYGDEYAQSAIEAFSVDDDLQCMPSAVSPMVIYYNTDLIDFEAMRARELPAPEEEVEGWTFEEFSAAAAYASRRGDDRGVSISPQLASLAPFLISGGGSLFEDAAEPTSLALSSNDNVETLETVLALLRDQSVTLSEEQLAEASPQEWFERGRLGMIEGFRELTPELRRVEGLDFDVMPMPQVGGPATIGEVNGLCLAPGDHVEPAADFLVHAISDEAVEPLARSGYVVPANVTVARSDAFLQPGDEPANAGAFNASLDNLVFLPLVEDAEELEEAVEPLLTEMLTSPGFIDVGDTTERIDEVSRSVLDPDYTPSPSGTESPSS